MPLVEYERILVPGKINSQVERIVLLDAPDTDGVVPTGLGDINVSIGERHAITGLIQSIALSGEVFRGTPLKNKHKKTSNKKVSVGIGGYGIQTLSGTERIIVRTWEGMNRSDQVRQIDLQLGVPEIIKR